MNDVTVGGDFSERSVCAQPPASGPVADACDALNAACERFRVGPAALALAFQLLSAELDQGAHAALTGGEAVDSGPRRAHLLAALPSASDASAGLAELERRGIVTAAPGTSWLAAEVSLDPRVRLACLAPPRAPAQVPTEPILSDRVRSEVERMLKRCLAGPRRYVLVVRGAPGAGREHVAQFLASSLHVQTLPRTPEELRGPPDPLEPELSGRAALWSSAGLDPSPEDLRRAAAWLARSSTVALVLVDPHQDLPDVPGRDTLILDLTPKSLSEREQVWTQALAGQELDEACAPELARRTRAGAGAAARACRNAAPDVQAALGVGQELTVRRAIERHLADATQASALRGILVERPEAARDALVLAPSTARTFERLMALAHAAATLGGARVGVKALFSGPSGTGKTLAARVLAHELDRPLFRIDLSTVVSKWVGETEKNLRHALAAAESAGAVLLFDEGDALLAKRGEVSRGADRYANLEAAYLLQALESHDGVVVVTTNLTSNLDPAFSRRFDASLHFPAPAREQRAALWRLELGEAGADLTPTFLDHQLAAAELAGGHIASAARISRALAFTGERQRVTEQDVRTAVAGELEKLGATLEAAKWLTPEGPPLSAPAVSRPHSPRNGAGRVVAGGKR